MKTILESQQEDKRPTKFYFLSILGIVTVLFVVSIFFWSSNESSTVSFSFDDVVIDTVRSGTLIKDVTAPGNLMSNHRQWLSARVSAKVLKRELEPGAVVTPDSIILRLSSPELLQQFKRVKIDYKVAQAQLKALKETHITEINRKQAAVKILEIEKKQAIEDASVKKQLRLKNLIPTYQYNEAILRESKLTLELEIVLFELQQLPKLHESLLNVELAKVEQQLLQVSLLEQKVELLNVRAQIHGVLQSISVEEGQEISQGTALARVADQTSLKAQLRVQESQANDIKISQKVQIDTRRSKISGVVSRIDPAVTNGTVTIDVELSKELPSEVRPDLRVNGTIEVTRLDNVLLLDKPSHWKNTKKAYFFKVGDESIASKTKVGIGEVSTHSIQLLNGLSAGDKVIISDTSALLKYTSITLY
jgi:HlyD family secretion protein